MSEFDNTQSIWRWRFSLNGFGAFKPQVSDITPFVRSFDGQSHIADWKVLEVIAVEPENQGDLSSLWRDNIPVFSAHALSILAPLIEGQAEILPLEADTGEFFAINCTVVLDCIDFNQSEVVYYKSGPIRKIKNLVLEPNCIDGLNIFRFKRYLTSAVFVSDEFKKTVDQHGLLGCDFVQKQYTT